MKGLFALFAIELSVRSPLLCHGLFFIFLFFFIWAKTTERTLLDGQLVRVMRSSIEFSELIINFVFFVDRQQELSELIVNVVQGDEPEGGETEGRANGPQGQLCARAVQEQLCASGKQGELCASRLEERLFDLLGAFALCLPLSHSQSYT
jgi:hypothetical protein